MFPFGIDGEIECHATSETAAAKLLDALSEVQAWGVHRNGDSIEFKLGLLRQGVDRWHPLAGVTAGVLIINPNGRGRLRYHISYIGFPIFVTAFAALSAALMPGLERFFVPPLVWLAVVGGGYWRASVGIPRFLRKTLGA